MGQIIVNKITSPPSLAPSQSWPRVKKAKPLTKEKVWDIFTNYLFVVPSLLLFAMFSIYPFFKIFQLSLFEWDGISPDMVFIGIRQYLQVCQDPIWWTSVKNASWVTFLALSVQNTLAFGLAWIVDQDLKAKTFYRVVFYLPPVLSGIVVGLVWNWVFDGNYGVLNFALTKIGLSSLCRAWLADPDTALNSVAIVHIWKGFGWGFVILLAGLQGIPRELYEAAKVDGASEWQILFRITLPIMIPVLFVVSILTILGTMQIYDIIVAMTQGGPGYHTEVPITRIFASLVGSSRFGYSCTMGVVFGAILLAISMVQIRLSKAMKAD